MSGLESGNAVLQTIHASEGGRALKLLKERQKRQKAVEQAKSEIEKEARRVRLGLIDEKYKGSSTEALEEAFKQDTIGLVTVEQFREKRKRLVEKLEENAEALKQAELALSAAAAAAAAPVSSADLDVSKGSQVKRKIKPERFKLSFDITESPPKQEKITEEEITQEKIPDEKKYFGKDPTVDTSFLFDAAREERLRKEREQLVQEYLKEQERVKEEWIEITYTLWDGSGKNKTMCVKKGSTVGSFLVECKKALDRDFNEIRSLSAENFLFVKEDVILFPTVTFYELIQQKIQGYEGLLLVLNNTKTVVQEGMEAQKDISSVAKIVDRRWYDRNKHIFPASAWRTYTPGKQYDVSSSRQ